MKDFAIRHPFITYFIIFDVAKLVCSCIVMVTTKNNKEA